MIGIGCARLREEGMPLNAKNLKEKIAMSDTKTSVHLLDATGHTTVEMTRQEVMDLPGVSNGER